jgi:hypothetical protein
MFGLPMGPLAGTRWVGHLTEGRAGQGLAVALLSWYGPPLPHCVTLGCAGMHFSPVPQAKIQANTQ